MEDPNQQNIVSDHASDAVNYLTDKTAWFMPQNMVVPQPATTGPDIESRVKILEETATHINVAKDQESRIMELESAVTELMEHVKEQNEMNKTLLELVKNPISVSHGSGGQPQYRFNAHQHTFSNPQPESAFDKAKRIMGIK